MNPGEYETYRADIEARRPTDAGGGACTLLVCRVDGRVELLFHGVLSPGAVLSNDGVGELAGYLIGATRRGQQS